MHCCVARDGRTVLQGNVGVQTATNASACTEISNAQSLYDPQITDRDMQILYHTLVF